MRPGMSTSSPTFSPERSSPSNCPSSQAMAIQAWQWPSVGGCLPRLTTQGQNTSHEQFRNSSPFRRQSVGAIFLRFGFAMRLSIRRETGMRSELRSGASLMGVSGQRKGSAAPAASMTVPTGRRKCRPIAGNFSRIMSAVAPAIQAIDIVPPTKPSAM